MGIVSGVSLVRLLFRESPSLHRVLRELVHPSVELLIREAFVAKIFGQKVTSLLNRKGFVIGYLIHCGSW
jgi:RecB family endonuclease NucS